MFKIKTFNKIDKKGLEKLTNDYEIVEGNDYDGIILRSYKMSEQELTDNLKAVARAGAGVNNIPVDMYAQKGVVVFNTPGANSNAVKELVLLGILLSARDVVGGINWVQSLKGQDIDVAKEVEANKSKFKGNEIAGKKAGIIGLGAIGRKVANALDDLGLDVYGFDPFLSINSAWQLNSTVSQAKSIEWLFENCDYISVHVPQNDSTKGFINKTLLAKAKEGIKIMNFARGGLINDNDLVEAVKAGKVAKYVTDFPDANLVGIDNIITVPHLGASTKEAETNCAVMAANEMVQYLTYANIINSVNYPNCDLGIPKGVARIAINHKKDTELLAQVTKILSKAGIGTLDALTKTKNDYAYTLIDADKTITNDITAQIAKIATVLKIRVLQ